MPRAGYGGTTTIFADGGHICANKGSEFCKSVGDEPGSVGGVVSSTHLAEGKNCHCDDEDGKKEPVKVPAPQPFYEPGIIQESEKKNKRGELVNSTL